MTPRAQLVGLLLAALAGFAALAVDVTHGGVLERHDLRVGLWVANRTPGWLEDIANAITQLGGVWLLVGLVAVGAALLVHARQRLDAALLVGGLVFGSLVTNGLKLAFDRPRPTFDAPSPTSHTASFPSGHTSGATVVLVLLAVLLAKRHRRAAIAGAVLVAGLVGVTRVVVEAHWATDVLAGYCVGAAVVAAALILRSFRARAGADMGASGERGEQDDGRDSRHEEGNGAGGALAEHRAHHLLVVGDLAEPQRG